MDWKIIYISKNLLEHRCLKWACMIHLDIWNTSYGQKWCTPNSLKDSNVSPSERQWKGEESGTLPSSQQFEG
jgi:hypothetical protein